MISTPLKQLSLLALSVLTAFLTACSSDNGQGKQKSKHGFINTPPIAQEANLTLKEDTILSITLQATDEDKDTLGYRVSQHPTHGKLTGAAPKLVYTPNPDYNGEDHFSFIANDGLADSTPATVKLAIIPVNDAPVARDDAISLNEDTPATITPLSNDGDVDGDALTIKSFTQPKHSTLTQTDNQLVYTPNQDYNGEDSFTYTITDGNATAKANITLTITPVNDAPLAKELNATLNENETTNITLQASDVDSQDLTYTITQQPTNGTLQGTPPAITYIPNKDFFGKESFSYIATDDKGAKSQETPVSITVNEHDITPPVITLNGESNITLIPGTPYVEQGASVSDNRDKNVSVYIEGSVDSNREGNYTLIYKAQDSSGNKAQAVRNVSVVSPQKDMGQLPIVQGDNIRSVKHGNIHIKLIHTNNDKPSDLSLLKLCNEKKCWRVLDAQAHTSNTIHPTQSYYVSDLSKMVFEDTNETIDRIQYIYKNKRQEIRLKDKLYFFRAIIDVLALKLEENTISEYLVSTAPPLEYSIYINEEDCRYVSKDGIIVETEAGAINTPSIINPDLSNVRNDGNVTLWTAAISIVNITPKNFAEIEKNMDDKNANFDIKLPSMLPKTIDIYIPLSCKNCMENYLKKHYRVQLFNKNIEYEVVPIDNKSYMHLQTNLPDNYFDFDKKDGGM